MSGESSDRNSSTSSVSKEPSQERKTPAKKKPQDFIFGKVIGEGSFSTVYLAKEISTGKEFAIKVVEKVHIIKEKKAHHVKREKEIFSRLNHPFFVSLFFTFQDPERLYFGLSYARRGELLDYLKKLGSFDEKTTRHYSAEILLALEHLHSLGIIHRDLKPENILLNEEWHIQITDFGTAKIVDSDASSPSPASVEPKGDPHDSTRRRRDSFVGTAQYVSPEVLQSKGIFFSSDLWALGSIIYQLLSGLPPFRGNHEYDIFQKILKLEYEFPDGFSVTAKELVQKLIVLDPKNRIGCPELGGYAVLKNEPFFDGIDWVHLTTTSPPELVPYLPANDKSCENLYSDYKAGLDDQQISRLLGIEIGNDFAAESVQEHKEDLHFLSDDERKRLLAIQKKENEYHSFVNNNLILKQGLVDKRKGLFARRRMFLLTEGPHLYYVDPVNMVLKGEVPWSTELKPEAKNFKIFFIHTPNRTYYLEDTQGYALEWCKKIEEVWNMYYSSSK